MRVVVVRNRKNRGIINSFGRPCPEVYGKRSVQKVMDSLRANGHEVAVFEGDMTLLPKLQDFTSADADLGQPAGLVFNMAYGIQGESRYTHVPAMLEMAGIPYTGASPLGHAVSLDKVIAKLLMQQAGVPTPAFTVMDNPKANDTGLRYPLMVKPRHESTSYGLQLVHDRHE